MFHVEFSKTAMKQLKKMEKPTAALILGWIEKNLENSTNPRSHGKALFGNKAGLWRYRVGDYRIIANIIDDKVLVFVVQIGHRRDIYD